MRRRILEIWGGSAIPPSMSKAADYALYDRTAQKIIIVDGNENLAGYPSGLFAPIGVVVVPGSHNVYGDGSCGVMSLKPMNCNTPSTGGTFEQGMYWGKYRSNISGYYFDDVSTGNTSNGIPTGQTTSYAYLPSDRFSGIGTQCAHDTDISYYSSPYIPSPYLTDGSRNLGYYQTTSPSSANNAMSDFDGIGNTEKAITRRGTKDYNSWKPTYNRETDYPAASCCNMFYTEGTSQGDWYLPACGELGYIMPLFNKINDAIDKMRTAYGSSVGVELSIEHYYVSSTEYNQFAARYVDTGDGSVSHVSKDYHVDVRAWLRVK